MADVIHKNEDLSELSEAEQLELVMRESKIDALSPEEQVWQRKIQNLYSYTVRPWDARFLGPEKN